MLRIEQEVAEIAGIFQAGSQETKKELNSWLPGFLLKKYAFEFFRGSLMLNAQVNEPAQWKLDRATGAFGVEH